MTPWAHAVLDVVDRIPRGRVMSYADVAEHAGGPVGGRSARAVGAVLARHGAEVPWHRVVMASGAPAPHKADEQLRLLRRDRTPLRPDGQAVQMRLARWAPD